MSPNIQQKALTRSIKLIESVDKFDVSKAVKEVLQKNGVSHDIQREVSSAFIESFNKEFCKIDEAKDWIDSVIKDMKP